MAKIDVMIDIDAGRAGQGRIIPQAFEDTESVFVRDRKKKERLLAHGRAAGDLVSVTSI